jgi:hypothetical protein
VARDDGDGLGYDVLSFDIAGGERHIEVKTTALGAETPFYISSAELDFACSHPRSFALYRVYDVLNDPRFYVLEGDISQAVELVPTVFRAQVTSTCPRGDDLLADSHQRSSPADRRHRGEPQR